MNITSAPSSSRRHIDSYRHKGLRQKLVQTLISKGIRNKDLLNAISNIPRHFMLDKAFEEWAYRDMAFPIEAQQTISMPFTVARQTELLRVSRGEKILEIGTGSGYQAAVLYHMGAKIYTIERQKTLFDRTSRLLEVMNLTGIRTLYGDGFKGAPRFAPFDKILITAGAATFPIELMNQLKVGGVMVIPMDEGKGQEMFRYVKQSESTYRKENHGPCAFVPMLSGTQ